MVATRRRNCSSFHQATVVNALGKALAPLLCHASSATALRAQVFLPSCQPACPGADSVAEGATKFADISISLPLSFVEHQMYAPAFAFGLACAEAI